MQRGFISLIILAIAFSGCRATVQGPEPRQASIQKMLPVTVGASELEPTIDHRPFQFWMHRDLSDQSPVLAANRTTKDLRYIASNEGLSVEVSPAAIRCMGEVFAIITRYNLERSEEWTNFRTMHPHRFLEVLPEVHDFHTYKSQHSAAHEIDAKSVTSWFGPKLWSGQEQRESGFRVRGYLKWRGILLDDGTTCLITRGDDVRTFLSHAMNCEAGDAEACTLVVEHRE